MPEDMEITKDDYAAWAESEGIELSEEEVAEAEEIFHLIDADGNGAHSKDELEAAFEFVMEGCPMDEEVQLKKKGKKEMPDPSDEEEVQLKKKGKKEMPDPS